MGTTVQPTTTRSPRRLVHLAAAVAALTSRAAAAETPLDPAPVEPSPRTPPVQSSYQTWLGLTAAGPIRDPLRLSVDLIGGFREDMHPAALLLRPALAVGLPHGFVASAGYTYVTFWNAGNERGEEHTPFQDVGYQAPFTEVGLFGRVRAEERFRAGSDVGVRLRMLVQLTVPIWRPARLEAVFSDEVFLGLNQPADWQPELMDMDLLYAGIGWAPDKHFRADVGYQAALVPRPEEISLGHCLSVGTAVFW